MNSNQNLVCKCLLVVSISPLLVVAITIPTNAVLASPGYRIINNAIVQSAGLTALLQTNGRIPTDGSGGAFGYGIVTTHLL
jgi:hypothetical protein